MNIIIKVFCGIGFGICAGFLWNWGIEAVVIGGIAAIVYINN